MVSCTRARGGDVVERRQQIDRLARRTAARSRAPSVASSTARAAFSAAAMLMLTWSSLLADVGIVSTRGRVRERLQLAT